MAILRVLGVTCTKQKELKMVGNPKTRTQSAESLAERLQRTRRRADAIPQLPMFSQGKEALSVVSDALAIVVELAERFETMVALAEDDEPRKGAANGE